MKHHFLSNYKSHWVCAYSSRAHDRADLVKMLMMPRQPAAMEAAVSRAAKDMGYFLLKPKQLEAVYSFMQGNDTFMSLPTGYGKSAIDAILPTAFDYFLGMFIVKIVMCNLLMVITLFYSINALLCTVLKLLTPQAYHKRCMHACYL